MARRYWKNILLILRGWGNTSSSVGFASGHQRYCLNLSGFGGYFPIPPRHAYAIPPLYYIVKWNTNVHVSVHFPIPSVKTGYWSIPSFSETGYWSIPYFSETGYWLIPSFSQLLFIFQSNTMLIAWIWLAGIGKFPPHPSAKKNLNSPLAASPLVGNSFFFASVFGRNFPMPPSHPTATHIVIEWKMKH